MLRLLAAALSLLSVPIGFTLAGPDHDPHTHDEDPTTLPYSMPAPPREPYELVVDATAMPGSAGWFLVPVRGLAATTVELEAKYRMAHRGDATQALAVIVGAPDQPAWAMTQFGHVWREAEVDRQGWRVACCGQATSQLAFSTQRSGGSFGGSTHWMDEGDTMWVGLAAVGWEEDSKLKITLRSYDAPLYAGAAVTGTTVEAVDLVDEARRAGTSARLGNTRLVGHDGGGARAWSPAGTGMLLAEAHAQGSSGGRFTLAVPGARLHDREDLHDESLGAAVFARGGTFEVRLDALHEPGFDVNPWDREHGMVVARALYADLSVPLDGLTAWHDPIEVEDDDW